MPRRAVDATANDCPCASSFFIALLPWAAARHPTWYFWFSLVAFCSTGLLFAIISNINLEIAGAMSWILGRFFLLPEIAAAPLVALGVVLLADLVASSAPAASTRIRALVAGALGVV